MLVAKKGELAKSMGVFTLPNMLTILRVLMASVAAVLFAVPGAEKHAVILCFFATILDAFDGWFARTLSQCSTLGKYMDPLADKFIIGVIYTVIALKADYLIVWLIFALVAARELAVTCARIYEYRRSKRIMLPSKMGKAKMVIQASVGIAILSYAYFVEESFPFSPRMLGMAFGLVWVISYLSAYYYFLDWLSNDYICHSNNAKRPKTESIEDERMVGNK